MWAMLLDVLLDGPQVERRTSRVPIGIIQQDGGFGRCFGRFWSVFWSVFLSVFCFAHILKRKFAHNIGINFSTPEEYFKNEPSASFTWDSVDLTTVATKGIIQHVLTA
jgi:hypothetical protein